LELEDDAIDRKRDLQQRDERDLQESLQIPANASCVCAQDAEQRAPTAGELIDLLQSFVDQLTFVTEVVELVEVNFTSCSEQLESFETLETVSIDLEEAFGTDAVVTKAEL